MTLRSDVRFHSGAPLTARDLVATLAALASPKVHSRHARIVDAVAESHAEGERVAVIRLARPQGTLLTSLELPILRADQAETPPAPDGTLDGLGPYSVARAVRGDLGLEPAAGGVLPRPAHGLTVRTVHDENARALRLAAGRADLAVNVVSATLLPALESRPELSVASRPASNLTYALVNESRAPLGDASVRVAISQAIDRASICASLFDGRAQPARGLVAPAHWRPTPTCLPLPFEPEAARAALAGRALGMTLLTSTDRLCGDVARVLAQGLAAAGVTLEVVPLELGTMLARLDAGDFDLAVLQLPEMTEPNVLRHFLHSSFVPPAGGNRGRVHDAELDALLDEGDRESDPSTRRATYARLEALERTQMHWIPLWVEDQVVVSSARARSFLPSAEGRWLAVAAIP